MGKTGVQGKQLAGVGGSVPARTRSWALVSHDGGPSPLFWAPRWTIAVVLGTAVDHRRVLGTTTDHRCDYGARLGGRREADVGDVAQGAGAL